jgi:predicted ferric reductase
MRLAMRGLFWTTVYAFVALAPLLVVRLGTPRAGRGLLVELSVALGFVALSIMVLELGLVARLERVAAPFGMDALWQYHRQMGFVALAFALAHPVLLVAHDRRTLGLLDWPRAPNRARFAVGATVALLLLVATSVWRKQLRLRYEAWRVLHGVLAVAAIGLALAHMAGVGYYLASPWQRALWGAIALLVVGDVVWQRVVRPLGWLGRPWTVDRVVAERGGAWTLVLRPERHAGLSFAPGQFGWILVGQSAFSIAAHPFSFSSSAERSDRLRVTIKARGDFTSRVGAIAPGTRAYVDGPYGSFSPDANEGPGFVLVAGGVGITPLMSMLETFADREERRPCKLFYGAPDWDGILFRERLEALAAQLDLEVVHVLERPPEGWTGERGFIDADLLRRRLPKRFERYQYFVCGPTPMMDAMEGALVAVGVPDERVHTERFEMV